MIAIIICLELRMPDLFSAFAASLYDLSNDMALYILLGLFFAGMP